MSDAGFDPSQIPTDPHGWGPYALFAAAGAFVLWVLKQAKDLFGNKKEPEGSGLRDYLDAKFDGLHNEIGAVGKSVTELREDFHQHRDDDRQAFAELRGQHWDGKSDRRQRA